MRILLADDHTIFRDGMKMLLARHPGFQVVAEAGDAGALRTLVRGHHPDLVLMDYHMPGADSGAELARLKQRDPQLRIIVLTAEQSGTALRQLWDAGADGILLKEGSADELLAAIRRVAAGERVMAARVRELMAQARVELTAREYQILRLIHAGMTGPAIAERFSLSARTVDKHRENLFRKLEVNNVAQLIRKAEELRLV